MYISIIEALPWRAYHQNSMRIRDMENDYCLAFVDLDTISRIAIMQSLTQSNNEPTETER